MAAIFFFWSNRATNEYIHGIFFDIFSLPLWRHFGCERCSKAQPAQRGASTMMMHASECKMMIVTEKGLEAAAVAGTS